MSDGTGHRRENRPPPRRPESDGPQAIWRCWSCQRDIGERTGVSLTGVCETQFGIEQEWHVCDQCWEDVPVAYRLLLQWLFRSKIQGGAGISDNISQIGAFAFEFSRQLRKDAENEPEKDFPWGSEE